MRGIEGSEGTLFSYVNLEARIPSDHPLRKMRQFVNASLCALEDDFRVLYSAEGRLRYRRSICCGRHCCSCFSPSARNGRWRRD